MHEGEVENKRDEVSTQGTQGVLRGCSEGAQIAQEERETVSGTGFSPISTYPSNQAAQGTPRAAQRTSQRLR